MTELFIKNRCELPFTQRSRDLRLFADSHWAPSHAPTSTAEVTILTEAILQTGLLVMQYYIHTKVDCSERVNVLFFILHY